MKKLSLITIGSILSLLLSTHLAFAATTTDALYYWGKMKSSPLSPAESCAIKITALSTPESSVDRLQLEALVYMAHEGKYVYTEELELEFDSSRQAYVFNSTESLPTIKQAALFLTPNTAEPSQFAASVFHHNHYDTAFCENLVEAQGDELILAEEFFNNWSTSSDVDHDHNHNHDHDHNHNHNHDHDHGHSHNH